MEYWLDGSNHEFVHLLENVDKVETYRLEAADDGISDSGDLDDGSGGGEDILAKGEQYFSSFRNDAKALWDVLSAPYSTVNDTGDFVVADGVEDNGAADDVRLAHLEFMRDGIEEEMEEDRRWVARLEKLSEKKGDEVDSYEAEKSEEENQDEGESEEENLDEGESSEDEWLATKRKSMEARRAKAKEQAAKRLQKQERGSSSDPFDTEDETNSADDERPPANRSKAKSTKRKSIQDSDDD